MLLLPVQLRVAGHIRSRQPKLKTPLGNRLSTLTNNKLTNEHIVILSTSFMEGHVAQLPNKHPLVLQHRRDLQQDLDVAQGLLLHRVRVLEAENAAFRQREQEQQRLFSQLQQDSEEKQRRNNQLQQDSQQQQQRRISQLQQDNQQQQQLISQLYQDNAQLLQNAVALTAVLLQKNIQQEECISAHTVCSQALSMQVVNSSVSCAAAENKLNWVKKELDSFKAEYAAMSEQFCSMKEQLKADMTAVEDQLQRADSDNTRLTEQLSLLQEQIQSPPPTPCAATPCVAASADSSSAYTITSSAAQQVSNMVSAAHKQSSQHRSPNPAQTTDQQQRATKKKVPKATGPRWR